MTTPQEPPQDPWQNAPGMSPEQPDQPPGQGYGPPGQGYGPPGQGYGAPGYGAPGQGAPGQQWGQPGPQYGGYPGPPPPAGNGMGITSLVLGIVGVLTSFIVVGGVLGVLALIFGIIGMRRAGTNKAMPVIGLVLGVVSILVAAAVVYSVADKVGGYAECVNDARTQAEMDACEREFRDRIENPQ